MHWSKSERPDPCGSSQRTRGATAYVQVSGTPALTRPATCSCDRRRRSAKTEIAGIRTRAVPRSLWRFRHRHPAPLSTISTLVTRPQTSHPPQRPITRRLISALALLRHPERSSADRMRLLLVSGLYPQTPAARVPMDSLSQPSHMHSDTGRACRLDRSPPCARH